MLTRPLALVFASSFGFSTSFYLMLSVVPLYAVSVGAGGAAAGLATGALMFSTVAAELLTPLLVSRFGYRAAFAAGLVLLGMPAFVLGVVPNVAGILTVCLVRGFGLGIVLVVAGALVAELVPPRRRGEGLGLYGVGVGVPFVVALPLGVWLAGKVGYAPAFFTGGLAALAGLATIPGLPSGTSRAGRPVGVLASLRNPTLRGPLAVFSVVAMAAGVVVTFVPLAVTGASGDLAAAALLAQASAATVSRWWAGRLGDRLGAATLLVPAAVASAVGVLAPAFARNPAVVLAGMAVFGAGWGVSQNATLALMLDRVAPSGFGAASALWYVAYDAGMGLGAFGFGVMASSTGYPLAFALAALIVLAAIVPAR